MDIAAMSMDLSTVKLAQDVQISMVKKAMDSQEASAAAMLEMLPPSPYNFDVRA